MTWMLGARQLRVCNEAYLWQCLSCLQQGTTICDCHLLYCNMTCLPWCLFLLEAVSSEAQWLVFTQNEKAPWTGGKAKGDTWKIWFLLKFCAGSVVLRVHTNCMRLTSVFWVQIRSPQILVGNRNIDPSNFLGQHIVHWRENLHLTLAAQVMKPTESHLQDGVNPVWSVLPCSQCGRAEAASYVFGLKNNKDG